MSKATAGVHESKCWNEGPMTIGKVEIITEIGCILITQQKFEFQ